MHEKIAEIANRLAVRARLYTQKADRWRGLSLEQERNARMMALILVEIGSAMLGSELPDP